MAAQHTPGPWRVNVEWLGDDLKGHVPISGIDKLALAQVVWRMEGEDSSPECEANAHLIAAAPALLAALATLHRVCAAMDLEKQDARPTEDEYQAAMQGAAAAIAIAKPKEAPRA